MASIGNLFEIGEKLGLKGDKLIEFIEKQQQIEREKEEKKKAR